MRIKAVSLSWFRGAATRVSMEPGCKSIVVYGTNGSGKSSFVDAIEYALNDGKIGHLAHEYSGKKQENATPNTHKPRGANTEFCIELCDGSTVKTEISNDGSRKNSGSICKWDYRRTVLRQSEVIEFIQDTKGGKYSALLPLLGLQPMEVAAENLRQLGRNIESLSQLELRKMALGKTNAERKAMFGTDSDDKILVKIKEVHRRYCGDKVGAADWLSQCSESTAAIDLRIAELSVEGKRYLALRAVAEIEFKTHINTMRETSLKLAGDLDPLVSQKLAVLEQAENFIWKVTGDGNVECPACGQSIRIVTFREHVAAELERLRAIRETFTARNAAKGKLCDSVRSLKVNIGKPDVKIWREQHKIGPLAECFTHLDKIDADALRAGCDETDLQQIERRLLPIVGAADAASVDAPPEAQDLIDDKRLIEVAEAAFKANEQAGEVDRAEVLVSILKALEQSTREEIRLRSETIIVEISEDIKRMWSILHPGDAIENVRLYVPKAADKAIDIGLKFHGKELESPRLTLSEGYRNSLGMCIFLAMAKREAVKDRPVVLDDVVISLDRNHRGMIVELLEKEFSARQVLILTHDRDWYTELRQQLDEGIWTFRALLPYETPQIGIRWSHKTTTFDDARAHLAERPDSAGNDVRKIMDVELALIAERLQIRLPYLRFDKNDRRQAHDFLERLIGDGKKCFQQRVGTDFPIHHDAIEALSSADTLLVSWANRASHSFDVVRPEAVKLIEACETALSFFKCTSCEKYIWFAVAEGAEWVQCQCGGIRWRYGKA